MRCIVKQMRKIYTRCIVESREYLRVAASTCSAAVVVGVGSPRPEGTGRRWAAGRKTGGEKTGVLWVAYPSGKRPTEKYYCGSYTCPLLTWLFGPHVSGYLAHMSGAMVDCFFFQKPPCPFLSSPHQPFTLTSSPLSSPFPELSPSASVLSFSRATPAPSPEAR